MQVVFERKPDFRLWDVVIETAIRLPKEEYEQLLSSPCDSYEFIEKNSRSVLMDEKNGVFYCMLVTGEGYRDGVLVEAEGYPYARYASYVSDGTALCYDSLSKVSGILAKTMEEIVEEGTNMTTTGNWMTDRSEVETLLEGGQSENPCLWRLLQDILGGRPEIVRVDRMDEGFDIYYYLDFCPNHIPEEGEAAVQEAGADIKVPQSKDILCARWEDVHLVHPEVNNVPHTIVESDSETLAEARGTVWVDVLNAKVERVYQGSYGLQVELSEVKPSRLDTFVDMLEGYYTVQGYETWVDEPTDGKPISP